LIQILTGGIELHWYVILDIKPDASLSEIKAAYRSKVKQYHPDVSEDPGYAYYKQGYNIFRKIHPSAFCTSTKNLFDVWVNKVRDEEAAKIVEKMIESFPKAYYYFSLVADEYPDSMWAPDSLEKIKTIEKMTPLYVKILRSFK
jgi:hypothetical protein